jgi:hypothetical protein
VIAEYIGDNRNRNEEKEKGKHFGLDTDAQRRK